MQISGSVALVTGANRGLGLAFAKALLAGGARKVYAAARNPASVTLPGVETIRLDVTNEAEIQAAAAQAGDVNLLINNAGIAKIGAFLSDGAIEAAQDQLAVNFFGPLRMARAFAPVLAANGGGAMINVLSVASWITGPMLASYAATKSAAWSLTNALRMELADQGTQIVGLHAGFIDTDLTQGLDVPKSTPESIVAAALSGLEQGELEVLADDVSRQVHQALTATPPIYLTRPE